MNFLATLPFESDTIATGLITDIGTLFDDAIPVATAVLVGLVGWRIFKRILTA